MIISAPNERRFGGISRLYGPAALQRFAQAHVCVVGVGGVGSWAVEALARSGIGRLTLIDLDNVAESNTNRQLHALTDNFGLPKVTALHRRILQINPACTVHEIEDFVDAENVGTLFAEPFDFVIDAIDQVRVKAAMAAHFVAQKQAFVVSGGAGGQRDPARETDAAPQGLSCAGYGASMLVTAAFGLFCAQAAIEHLAAQVK